MTNSRRAPPSSTLSTHPLWAVCFTQRMSNVCVDKAALSGHSTTSFQRLLNHFRDSTIHIYVCRVFFYETYQLQSLDEYGANCFYRYHSADIIVDILQLG